MVTESTWPRPDDEPSEVDLEALAGRYGLAVPNPPVRRLVHRHDQAIGLIIEVGKALPQEYGRHGAIAVAILGGAGGYLVVSRKRGSPQDEDRILVGMTSVERVEGFGE